MKIRKKKKNLPHCRSSWQDLNNLLNTGQWWLRKGVPDLYIPTEEQIFLPPCNLIFIFYNPAFRHSLTLQALFAFNWETQRQNSAVDIHDNGTSQATIASPWREHPLFVQVG